MKVKSIIYMVLALSLCCGCSDWLTVDSKTILSEEDIAKYPELAEAQFLSNYAELRKSIHCIGDGNDSFTVEADNLLNFIKFRRSVRRFKDKEVEQEKIEKIIEAGRFTQTSTNSQDVSYIVVSEKLAELRDLVYESLKVKGEAILANLTPQTAHLERYARMWVASYEMYKQDPVKNDKIFFNAPVAIFVHEGYPGHLYQTVYYASTKPDPLRSIFNFGGYVEGWATYAEMGSYYLADSLTREQAVLLQKNSSILLALYALADMGIHR